jgi:cadmium resistance protein CadD (predicted permease)
LNDVSIAIAEGITAFSATNVDDLVILLVFFAQTNATFKPYHVVIGAYWGFAVLVVLSLIGFFGGLIVSPAWIGLLGLVPIIIGIKQLWERQQKTTQVQTVTDEFTQAPSGIPLLAFMARLLHPQAYQVAGVTFANGGDNIGIYVPLFASSDAIALLIILVVFLLLKGVWCYVAYQLTRHPKVAYVLTRYGHRFVPFVLIGLGFFILWKNGTIGLLFPT